MGKGEINKEALIPYLKLNGDTYNLELSLDEALKLGISKDDYQSIIECIDQTNRDLKELKNDTDQIISFFDPLSYKANGLRGPGPSGTITTDGQEERNASFYAPSGATNVRFQCRTNAAFLPIFICRLKTAVGTWVSKTEVGFIIGVTLIDIALADSNYEVTITFRTSDSNGGSCNWECS